MNTKTNIRFYGIADPLELTSLGYVIPEGVHTVPVWEVIDEGVLAGFAYWVGGAEDNIVIVRDPYVYPRMLPDLEGRVLNLTPHAIGILMDDGHVEYVRPSGLVARATEEVTATDSPLPGVAEVVSKTYGVTTGLPPVGAPVLISRLAAAGCAGREMTFIPDSGPTAARKDGQVSYCIRLIAA
jgi:hypothetical protein